MAIFLSLHLPIAVADEVPTLDYRTACRTAGQRGVNVQACLEGEQRSREHLVEEWAQYAPEDKTRCTRMAKNIAGLESYTELFACLRAAKAVKSLPKE
jgi:hypothetical protein